MNELIREMFLTDWVKEASTKEIVEKLIQNDERAKEIIELKNEIEYWKNRYENLLKMTGVE